MKRFTVTAALLVGLTIVWTGCGRDAGPPVGGVDLTGSDDPTQLDFSQPYGGLTSTAEAVAFDDPALLAIEAAEADEEIDDPTARDPEAERLRERARTYASGPDSLRPRFTFVHLRWGMLRGPGDTLRVEPPCDVTDWTGTIRTDRGVVVVRRVLAFERPADHIILPRLDRRTVALVSHTACGSDGLVLQIMERADERDADGGEDANRLHIDLGPYSASFAVSDVASLHEVTEVDDLNSIAVTGFTPGEIEFCPEGFLSGRWRILPASHERPDSLPGDQIGTWAGVWRGSDGRIAGFMRGGYGRDESGTPVFVGKLIGRSGGFRGLVRGTWSPGETDEALARFVGDWASAGGRIEGRLGGEAHGVDGYPGGYYVGRWATLCDEEAVENVM